jgi:hypothetical protein
MGFIDTPMKPRKRRTLLIMNPTGGIKLLTQIPATSTRVENAASSEAEERLVVCTKCDHWG